MKSLYIARDTSGCYLFGFDARKSFIGAVCAYLEANPTATVIECDNRQHPKPAFPFTIWKRESNGAVGSPETTYVFKNKPDHLFLSSDGNLYDTRSPEWSKLPPLRPMHSYTHRTIRTGLELRQTLRAGPYAWPGGYPIVLICADGELVSPAALTKDRSLLRQALADILSRSHERIVGADIYHEGPPMQCAYSGEMIESAYGDPDAPQDEQPETVKGV